MEIPDFHCSALIYFGTYCYVYCIKGFFGQKGTMNVTFRKFIWQNLLITFILAILGVVLFYFFLSAYYHPLYPILLLVALTANILSYYLSTQTRHTGIQIINAIIKSFGIRFMMYLGVAVAYMLLVDSTKQRVIFILALFCIYLIYSLLEITSLLKLIKGNK